MIAVCKKHRATPAKGYNPCPGCEIESLQAELAEARKVQEPAAWSDRELELIDGMIEVQLRHADQCDRIANRDMAEERKILFGRTAALYPCLFELQRLASDLDDAVKKLEATSTPLAPQS